MEPFHGEEVVDLLSQYADEAAIAFSPEASRRIQDTTEGHPLLVNAIAQRLVGDDFEGRPAEVGVEHVDRAVGDLIAGRSVLDDQPAAGVDDPRVGRVLDRMVAGAHLPVDRSEEALERAIGLGLLRVERCTARIANPLFREAILRVWTRAIRARPRRSTAANAGPRGTVDVRAILEEFQAVWRLDGHRMATDLPAQKARPHVILFAFLHHALPEGARIESDYGFGRDGVQFDVTWRERTYAIESKVSRAPNESVALLGRSAGRQRTSGECEHWLVLFDLRRDLDWEQKHYLRTERVGDRSVHVVGV